MRLLEIYVCRDRMLRTDAIASNTSYSIISVVIIIIIEIAMSIIITLIITIIIIIIIIGEITLHFLPVLRVICT